MALLSVLLHSLASFSQCDPSRSLLVLSLVERYLRRWHKLLTVALLWHRAIRARCLDKGLTAVVSLQPLHLLEIVVEEGITAALIRLILMFKVHQVVPLLGGYII